MTQPYLDANIIYDYAAQYIFNITNLSFLDLSSVYSNVLIWIHSLDYDTRKICFNSQGIGCVIDWENYIILHDKHCIGILDANAIHFNYLIILSIINLCYISSSTLLFVVSFCYSTCSMLKIHHNIVLHSHMI